MMHAEEWGNGEAYYLAMMVANGDTTSEPEEFSKQVLKEKDILKRRRSDKNPRQNSLGYAN